MTVKQKAIILENIIKLYKTQSVPYGSLYITTDGTLLDLGNTGHGHSDLANSLAELGVAENYQEGKASQYLKQLGWIRANTDSKWRYIELSDKQPTSAQYSALLQVLDRMNKDVQITFKDCYKIYRDRISEEVVKLIKRYYATGIAYEHLEEK